MAHQLEHESRHTAEPSRVRRPDLIRSPDQRRAFPVREAQRLLQQKERHWAPLAYGVIIAAMLLIFATAYTSYAFSRYRGEILPSVYVDNTSLGGLTASQATTLLTRKTGAAFFLPVRLVYGKLHWEPGRADIGLGYEIPQTVHQAEAVGREGPFVEQLVDRLPFHPAHQVPLLFRINEPTLRKYIETKIVQPLQRPVKNAGLYFNPAGYVAVRPSQSGNSLNVPAAEHIVHDALGSLSTQTRALVVEHPQPAITNGDAQRVADRVNNFLKHPPVLAAGTSVFITRRSDFQPMLSFQQRVNGSHASLIMIVNPDQVHAYLTRLAARINRPPQNAKLAFSAGKVQLLSLRRTGRTLNQQDAYAKLLSVISHLKAHSRLHFTIAVTQPSIDQTNPASLGINRLLATGKSQFQGASTTRLNDITSIAKVLDNDLLPPGQQISFNTLVGAGWSSQVYTDQEMQSAGHLVPGDGGAMQQVATTFLRAMYDAGLKVLERHAHKYRLPWYEPPLGFDALVAPDRNWDLRFANNTGKYLLIQTRVEPIQQALYIYVYGPKLGWSVSVSPTAKITKVYPHGPQIVRQDPTLLPGQTHQVAWPHDGAKTILQRTITYPNGDVKVDELRTTYQPWQAILYVGPGTSTGKSKLKKTPTPQPSATPSP
jgi:vancomycin resistance protein YoaR